MANFFETKDWIKENISPEAADKFDKNYNDKHFSGVASRDKHKTDSVYSFILGSFIFHLSPEGPDYWEDILDKAQETRPEQDTLS